MRKIQKHPGIIQVARILPHSLLIGGFVAATLALYHTSAALGREGAPPPSKIKHQTTVVPRPAPVIAPAPAPAAVAKPVTSVQVPKPTAASKPAPVVTPSPASSVSSLTPTSPSPATSGASGPTATSYTSSNWSGYLMTGGSFTRVAGSWVATNPTGIAGTTSADSTWIGIGGVTSGDLIQIGTQNIITPSGQVQSSAFYEMLPDYAQPIAIMTITPGDVMTAIITQTAAGQWSMTIADTTTGQSFSKDVAYASSLSSAEWIQEDPSYSRHRQIPFDHFGLATFTNSLATKSGANVNLATGNAQPISMIIGGQRVATPSPLRADGASFSVSP